MQSLEPVINYLVDPNGGLKQVILEFLNVVMQYEAYLQSGALPYERGPQRKAHRNGTRPRTLKTRVGEITLDKPQFREFPFETKVFERYSRVDQALLMIIAESYIQGVSTRRMEELVKSFGLDRLSASEVSRICKILDEKVEEFLKRPIETKIPYLLVDATYFKVRQGAQYKSRALLIVVGIREDGLREILGASIAESEDSGFWSALFQSLKDRGLEGVEMVISDAHKGIQKAVESSFLGASWQYCHVHFSRAVLESIPKKDKTEIAEKLKDASEDEMKMQDLAKELRDLGHKPAAETIDRFRFDLWNYKAYPKAHWKRLRTTNVIERINKELKRRSRPVGAFPSDKSLMRLAGCILININEEWVTGKKYLSMDEV
ncbi:MAG: IS256 family transposase [Methanothrix sp.]|nr:IS256 family transposase [Methanothrix sp.]